MSRTYSVAGVVTLLVLIAIGGGAAEPALRGYSGLLLLPTADSLDRNQYNVSLNSSEITDFEDRSYIFNYGLADDIEGGLLWFHPDHGPTETLINIKYRFERGTSRRASLAVGVADLTDQLDTSVYVIATKEIGEPVGSIGGHPVHMLRVHGGIGSGMFDDFFFGAEARLAERLTLMAEHVNDQINVGARLRLWRNFTVDAGWLDADDLAVALTYNYPLQAAEELTPVVTETRTTEVSSVSSPPAAPTTEVAQTPQTPPATVEMKLSDVQPEPAPKTEVAQVPENTGSPTVETSQDPPVTCAAASGQAGAGDESGATATGCVDPDKPLVEIPLGGVWPDVISGHIFLPVRPVAEWLGFRVAADFTAQGLRVTVFAGMEAAEFYVGDAQVSLGTQSAQLPAATYLQNNEVTMVPAEFFQLLGVPTEADPGAGQALLERHDAVGIVFLGK